MGRWPADGATCWPSSAGAHASADRTAKIARVRWGQPARSSRQPRRKACMNLLEQHEIAESSHRILNPFTEEKLMLLGEVCRLRPGMRHLDLASGKGELLCRWSATYGIEGLGVDISSVFVSAARERAA